MFTRVINYNSMLQSAGKAYDVVLNGITLHPKTQIAPKSPSDRASSKLEQFEEMMLPHLNAAYNLARWLTHNGHDVDDVVQESYLRAFRFFDRYQHGDSKAWLLAIVRNTCRTWLRREDAARSAVIFDEGALFASADGPSAEERLAEASRAQTLRNCIAALPEEYREVLVMRELEEMSYREIAEVAGVPVGTVMSRLFRARKQLLQRLLCT
jgi:RNA polymerase sigma-70 factor (ECF subfamily)